MEVRWKIWKQIGSIQKDMNATHQMIRFDNAQELGAWYDQKYTEMGGGWKIGEEGARRIMEWSGIVADQSKVLLDVGCGDGDFIRTAQQYVRCIGIDLSSVGIEYAKSMNLNAEFYVADIETYQHVPQVDYITSLGSIEHCISIPNALSRCFANLRNKGKFYCLVPNELWKHFDQPQETTHTDEEWSHLFTKAGFSIEKIERRSDLTDFLLRKDV